MAKPVESDLAAPVTEFLNKLGYEVKSEVKNCDLVAVRGDEAPVVVELKAAFNLKLLLQGVDRTTLTDLVYIAFHDGPGKSTWKKDRRLILRTCRMLGLGILVLKSNRDGSMRVLPELDPGPYEPRKNPRKSKGLAKEFSHRVGDANLAGTTRRKIVTAYRQDALRLAHALQDGEPRSLANLRKLSNVEEAAKFMQRDVYGWFERAGRGVYQITPVGAQALEEFSDVVENLLKADAD